MWYSKLPNTFRYVDMHDWIKARLYKHDSVVQGVPWSGQPIKNFLAAIRIQYLIQSPLELILSHLIPIFTLFL